MDDLLATRRANAAAFVRQGLGKKHTWAALPYAYDIQEDDMLFLCWFDDNAKKPTAAKLTEAQTRYTERFGVAANVVLVNEADAGVGFPGCEVRVERRIRKDNYQLGRVES